MLNTLYVFLDVDGVLNAYYSSTHGKLCPELVSRLNRLLEALMVTGFDPHIILNSSWNARLRSSEEKKFRTELLDNGLSHINCLKGSTSGCGGGGREVRRWLTDNDAVGESFIIIDDEPREYDELWSRLIWTRGNLGLTETDYEKALATATREITDTGERRAAVANLIDRCYAYRDNHWMSKFQIDQAVISEMRLVAHLISTTDFLAAAMLKKPDTAKIREIKGS